MRFRKSSLEEMLGRIRQWLTKCPICGNDDLRCWKYPALVQIGGFQRKPDDPRFDPESNVLFYIMVDCIKCGHVMFFNPEHLVGNNEQILISGMTPEEEASVDL